MSEVTVIKIGKRCKEAYIESQASAIVGNVKIEYNKVNEIVSRLKDKCVVDITEAEKIDFDDLEMWQSHAKAVLTRWNFEIHKIIDDNSEAVIKYDIEDIVQRGKDSFQMRDIIMDEMRKDMNMEINKDNYNALYTATDRDGNNIRRYIRDMYYNIYYSSRGIVLECRGYLNKKEVEELRANNYGRYYYIETSECNRHERAIISRTIILGNRR